MVSGRTNAGGLALKLVESPSLYRREVQLWSSEAGNGSHTLHQLIHYPEVFPAELPAYFIDRFTKPGQVVLDPFCGSGTTPLVASLLGRVAFAGDINPYAVRISAAKLFPADLGEVTLKLQLLNLRRLADICQLREKFHPYYDVNTYRELVNLKSGLEKQNDRVSQFVEIVAASLLHGHSAGYFSVYTFPQISLTPSEQERLNISRVQVPDYRAVAPRILRKTASVLRDGIPGVLGQHSKSHRLTVSDARHMRSVASASVDLIVTAPPPPVHKVRDSDLWLRNWFCGIGPTSQPLYGSISLVEWEEMIEQSLMEMARVSKIGARCVLDLKAVQIENEAVLLDEFVHEIVQRRLARYWEVEGVLVQSVQFAKLKDSLRSRDREKLQTAHRMLVLRRR